jgi:adenosylmethionine-8-amino-7-oxononanoate aminotransferase
MQHGVWMRPFEEFVYLMPSYIITDEELDRIFEALDSWFN